MRVIGVISDTHGLLREEALAELEGSDLILHAGDVGDMSIIRSLAEIAPVRAVRGNTDHGAVVEALPGTGWYSQVLIPWLGAEGRLIGANYAQDMWPRFGVFDQAFIDSMKTWTTLRS